MRKKREKRKRGRKRSKAVGRGDEKIKEILDGDRSLQPETRSEIYDMLFAYYGMEVKQMNPEVIKQNVTQEDSALSHEERAQLHQVFIRDKSNLLDDLNAIYGTETGQKLLTRMAANRERDDSLGTQIYLGYTMGAPYTESLGHIEDEQYHSGEDRYQKGRGAGTVIVMNSRELSEKAAKRDRTKLPKDDSRVMLAHELIHALHAQMGVKPTWETLVHGQYQPSSADLDAWLDAEFQREGYSLTEEFLDRYPEFAGQNRTMCRQPGFARISAIRENCRKFAISMKIKSGKSWGFPSESVTENVNYGNLPAEKGRNGVGI